MSWSRKLPNRRWGWGQYGNLTSVVSRAEVWVVWTSRLQLASEVGLSPFTVGRWRQPFSCMHSISKGLNCWTPRWQRIGCRCRKKNSTRSPISFYVPTLSSKPNLLWFKALLCPQHCISIPKSPKLWVPFAYHLLLPSDRHLTLSRSLWFSFIIREAICSQISFLPGNKGQTCPCAQCIPFGVPGHRHRWGSSGDKTQSWHWHPPPSFSHRRQVQTGSSLLG